MAGEWEAATSPGVDRTGLRASIDASGGFVQGAPDAAGIRTGSAARHKVHPARERKNDLKHDLVSFSTSLPN